MKGCDSYFKDSSIKYIENATLGTMLAGPINVQETLEKVIFTNSAF